MSETYGSRGSEAARGLVRCRQVHIRPTASAASSPTVACMLAAYRRIPPPSLALAPFHAADRALEQKRLAAERAKSSRNNNAAPEEDEEVRAC